MIWSLNGLCVCHNNNRAYKTDNPKRNVCQAGMPKSVSQHHICPHTLVRSDSALCALLAFEEHSDVDLLWPQLDLRQNNGHCIQNMQSANILPQNLMWGIFARQVTWFLMSYPLHPQLTALHPVASDMPEHVTEISINQGTICVTHP